MPLSASVSKKRASWVSSPGCKLSSTSGLECGESGRGRRRAEQVEVRVLNGTTRSGFAGSVSEELAARGYTTGDPGNTSQASGPATIVHGPEAYLAAQSLLAQVPGAQLRMEQREGPAVDLLLGDGFQRAAVGQLEAKLVLGMQQLAAQGVKVKSMVVSGGVASNSYLRER